jgi:hypothetical protein
MSLLLREASLSISLVAKLLLKGLKAMLFVAWSLRGVASNKGLAASGSGSSGLPGQIMMCSVSAGRLSATIITCCVSVARLSTAASRFNLAWIIDVVLEFCGVLVSSGIGSVADEEVLRLSKNSWNFRVHPLMKLLTVINYHYKPSTKHIKRIKKYDSHHRIGVLLTISMSFGEL